MTKYDKDFSYSHTVVSLDLDYFNPWSWYLKDKANALITKSLSKMIASLTCPISVIENHQQILVNCSDYGWQWENYKKKQSLPDYSKLKSKKEMFAHLISWDTHSDLGPIGTTTLGCGSWANYVPWRHRGVFTWKRADALFAGRCCRGDCFPKEGSLLKAKKTDWALFQSIRITDDYTIKTLKESLALLREDLSSSDLLSFTICMSPGYTEMPLYNMIQNNLEKEIGRVRIHKGTEYESVSYFDVKPMKWKL